MEHPGRIVSMELLSVRKVAPAKFDWDSGPPGGGGGGTLLLSEIMYILKIHKIGLIYYFMIANWVILC